MLKMEAQSLEDSLSERGRKNKVLGEHYGRGKELAAGLLLKLMVAPVVRVMRKWKQKSEESTIEELKQVLEEKISKLKKLEEINTKLEGQNNDLLVENEDLRQSSMDGMEIANVPYTLILLGYSKNDQRKRAIERRLAKSITLCQKTFGGKCSFAKPI